MSDPTPRRPKQSAALLIGIVLTIGAVFAHRLLPERRLTLDSTREGANFFLMQSGEGAPSQVDWIDQPRMHFFCRFPEAASNPGCSLTYVLYPGDESDKGIDLSGYRRLNLSIHYTGPARYVRIAVRNFDQRFSTRQDYNSAKFNTINLHPKDLLQPLAIDVTEFTVPEWWLGQYDLPREQSHPDFRNATAFSIDLLGDLAGTNHDIRIDKIEFAGDWISAENWYLGIVCLWLVLAASYGVSQWMILRRRHREQRLKIHELVDTNEQLQSEKEKYQKLSTVDGLTKVLNRHGIEQFIETLKASNLPTSVIVIDLDHFKKINDLRGHYVGDRVLQTLGEILRSQTRNTDGLGRWGGEEFVLVCPGATLSKAADLAEKLRHRILQTNFIPEDPIAVTASFGVATARAGDSFEDVFNQADQALYLAKSRGRNCVVAAGEDQMHTVTGARRGTWALISGRFRLHHSEEKRSADASGRHPRE